jgi:hypothetical protein
MASRIRLLTVEEHHVFTSLLPQVVRMAALPAAAGPWAAVLVPVLAYVATQRSIKLKVAIG